MCGGIIRVCRLMDRCIKRKNEVTGLLEHKEAEMLIVNLSFLVTGREIDKTIVAYTLVYGLRICLYLDIRRIY